MKYSDHLIILPKSNLNKPVCKIKGANSKEFGIVAKTTG